MSQHGNSGVWQQKPRVELTLIYPQRTSIILTWHFLILKWQNKTNFKENDWGTAWPQTLVKFPQDRSPPHRGQSIWTAWLVFSFFFLSVRESLWQEIGLLWAAFNIPWLRAMGERRVVGTRRLAGTTQSACTRSHTQMDTQSHPVCTNEGGRWRVWCMSLWADREKNRQQRGERPPRSLMAWSNGNPYWINNLHAEQTGPVGRLNRQTGADSGSMAGYSSSPCQLIGQQL